MGLKMEYLDGQTPIDENEKEGLLIKSITTRAELDELEQLNIQKAVEWVIESNFDPDKVLAEEFIIKVHKKMFSNVWKWAGVYRQTEKNIGVRWVMIPIELRYLIDDTKFWIANETYPPDEIAIRFKHKLVSIHCFPNGNGRHSRIMADIIIESIFDKEIFSWNNSNMVRPNEARKNYIAAIKEADNGNIRSLIEFARK